jgi:type II secretory pathway predicted ATPase ExeA
MGHQLLGQEAPVPPAAKKPLAPFITDCHRNAIDKLGRAFEKSRPLTLLIGEGKSGAAFVIGRFLSGISSDTAVARITEPCSTAIELMREIVAGMGFDPKSMSLGDLEQVLKMFLIFQQKHNCRTIICIEETQDNSNWVLDRINRLVEMEKKNEYGLMVILAGRPALNDLLKEAPLNATSINGVKRIVLAPFTIAETKEYIRRRVEGTGASDIEQVFTFNAITAIQELGSGIPDKISSLCSKCLELADLEDTTPVRSDLVERAAKLLRLANMVEVSDAVADEVHALEQKNQSTGRLIAFVNHTFAQEQKLNGGHVLIGRDELCDIRLDNIQVSRHHALIVNSSIGVKLVDLGSTNGTLVNGEPIRKHTLQDKDKITVGDCSIEFVAGAGHRSWYFDVDPTVTTEANQDGFTLTGNGTGYEVESLDSTKTMLSQGF